MDNIGKSFQSGDIAATKASIEDIVAHINSLDPATIDCMIVCCVDKDSRTHIGAVGSVSEIRSMLFSTLEGVVDRIKSIDEQEAANG